MKPTCDKCVYYHGGYCRRYPEQVPITHYNHWCGEFKAKECETCKGQGMFLSVGTSGLLASHPCPKCQPKQEEPGE